MAGQRNLGCKELRWSFHWWLLRRYGTTSDLCIGVRLEQGEFAAHAWVEKDGIPLNDRPEFVARYAIFESK